MPPVNAAFPAKLPAFRHGRKGSARLGRKCAAGGQKNLFCAEDAVARDSAPMRGAKPLRGSKPQADDSPCGKVLLRKTLVRAPRGQRGFTKGGI